MRKIDKIAIVDAALAGQAPEQIPFSVWQHFPPEARGGRAAAAAHLEYFRGYDLDFLKVMNDNPYDMPADMPVVEMAKDWGKLKPLRGDEPGFAAELEALKIIKKEIGAEARFIVTVFSPFATAMKVSAEKAVLHLREDPETFEKGLETIARGLAAFAVRAIEAGASGIYMATVGAEPSMLSSEEYRRIVRPYDTLVLGVVESAPFNCVHVHGTDVYFELFTDYPARAINWPSHKSAWPVERARKATGKCLVAGIDERGPVAQSRMRGTISEVSDAVSGAGRAGIMIAGECAIPLETRHDVISAVRDLVAQM